MGVSLSSALWSPPLQARSSLLMSLTAASPGCAALSIADGAELYGRAVPTNNLVLRDPLVAHSAPIWNGGTYETTIQTLLARTQLRTGRCIERSCRGPHLHPDYF